MNSKPKKIIPWLIVGLLFIVTALSFLDRQVLSMSIIKIKEDIQITDTDYSWITNGFIAGYALMFTLGGVFIDKFGTKLGLAISLAIWSLAAGLHSIATTVSMFVVFRFILGIGEGACFPGAIKAVIEWIPANKRSLATGIAIGGSAIGAVVAPLLSIYVLNQYGWRLLFLISPVISIVWVAVWLFLNRKKNTKLKVIQQVDIKQQKYSFAEVLRNRNTWIFIVMRVLFDPIFYFLMFWIPKFMNESRGISLDLIGKLFWIPFLVLGISNILGGYFSDKLLDRTKNINMSRKVLMGFGAVLTLSVLIIPMVNSAYLVITLISVFFLAHGFWITNYSTVIGDVYDSKATSTVFGLTGTFGAVSAFFVNRGIGFVVTNYSYDPLWVWAGLMYPLALIIFLIFVPDILKAKQRILQ